jgi:hypothetical protein
MRINKRRLELRRMVLAIAAKQPDLDAAVKTLQGEIGLCAAKVAAADAWREKAYAHDFGTGGKMSATMRLTQAMMLHTWAMEDLATLHRVGLDPFRKWVRGY